MSNIELRWVDENTLTVLHFNAERGSYVEVDRFRSPSDVELSAVARVLGTDIPQKPIGVTVLSRFEAEGFTYLFGVGISRATFQRWTPEKRLANSNIVIENETYKVIKFAPYNP